MVYLFYVLAVISMPMLCKTEEIETVSTNYFRKNNLQIKLEAYKQLPSVWLNSSSWWMENQQLPVTKCTNSSCLIIHIKSDHLFTSNIDVSKNNIQAGYF